MKNGWPQLGRGLVDTVFPPVCVNCNGLVEHNPEWRHVCPRCVAQMDFVHAPQCTTCGHPFYGHVIGERLCPHCESLHPAFREGRTAVLLKGAGRALVHGLKYHRQLHVLTDIAAVFRRSPALLDFVRDGRLVPVPLHPRKERERGYNQSLLLAETLAEVAGGATTVAPILRRVADTETQTHRDRRERQLNLKNAFALACDADINTSQHYLLVDDVFTTGSTLNSCALVLRRAGILNLDVVTFGHG
ncbi:ComF family protein [Horticoccus luteus]|uniref:ComF family protein n=1 Tax=Horticoccus luteus TaxID=2862869 RepID=A0A8F9XMT2_9BACT|nr:ComF family protein [Horticoccus luteus]QYM80394.1 ComF family protein [Horticoccus luteus]